MEAEMKPAGQSSYALHPSPICSEDILFCIDAGSESLSEMKSTGSGGRATIRLDSIKQAVLLFVHSKLAINSTHRFALASFSRTPSWLRKEFTSNVDSVITGLRGLSVSSSPSSGKPDLTQLFQEAACEAKKSRAQNRILRLILIYCRSSSMPQYRWPVGPKLFTLDVVYLHDKPGPDNCPQAVYDALVEALEGVSEHEGYIFESGQGLQRLLFRHVCTLLAHPQQRCFQEDLVAPKSLTKKTSEIVSVGKECGSAYGQ